MSLRDPIAFDLRSVLAGVVRLDAAPVPIRRNCREMTPLKLRQN